MNFTSGFMKFNLLSSSVNFLLFIYFSVVDNFSQVQNSGIP